MDNPDVHLLIGFEGTARCLCRFLCVLNSTPLLALSREVSVREKKVEGVVGVGSDRS